MAQASDGIQKLAEAQPTSEQDKAELSRQIQGMDVAERIELARMGNSVVRNILIRDQTREVQVALVNNPRITETEIERIVSASTVSDEVLRVIAKNRRWIRNDAILLALVKNPKTPASASLRLLRLLGEEELDRMAQTGDAPSAVLAAVKKVLAKKEGPRPPAQEVQAPKIDEGAIYKLAETQPVNEQERVNLFLQIRRMGVGERIKLGMLGNKEVRSLLIRDPARAVQVAVINNPRITDTEVERIAASKIVDEEVIRLIINNREWVKNYAIKLALVKNARVPIQVSMRFLAHLRDRDLKDLARSKDIPNVVVVGAKKLLQERRR